MKVAPRGDETKLKRRVRSTHHGAHGAPYAGWVSELDAKNFACNAISIDQTIIMHRASAELKFELAQRGIEVIETDVSEFIKSGGACKCLTLEILTNISIRDDLKIVPTLGWNDLLA